MNDDGPRGLRLDRAGLGQELRGTSNRARCGGHDYRDRAAGRLESRTRVKAAAAEDSLMTG